MNNDIKEKQQYPSDNCKDCIFLKVIYQLDEDQYQFGCDNQLTCKYVEKNVRIR